MLGHKSATMTLDQYGHLFDDRLDDIGDRLDAAARVADGYVNEPNAPVRDLHLAQPSASTVTSMVLQ